MVPQSGQQWRRIEDHSLIGEIRKVTEKHVWVRLHVGEFPFAMETFRQEWEPLPSAGL